MDDEGSTRKSRRPIRLAVRYGAMVRRTGIALSIPGLLLAGPLVGYGLGWVAMHYLGCPKWSPVAGLFLGLVSGIRESVIMIQKMAQESEEDSDE